MTAVEPSDLPTLTHAAEARRRIAPHIHRTPVLTSTFFDELLGARLFFKCENLQKTGSFKARGATNAVFGLDEESARRGVVTHSSGNHGQALAFAARRRGIPATVVMPHNATGAKKAAVLGYGGRIVECEPTASARKAALDAIAEESGANIVHPYDDARIIAGQASAGTELIEEIGDLDAIIAPIGGGGLISGMVLAGGGRDIRIYGAEPANADDACRSLRAGHRIIEDAPQTIADGLRSSLGALTWQFVSEHVADILLASEDAIIEAMYLVWQRMKIVIEPSSAVPLAAMTENRGAFAGKRVGVIVSGGNVDLDALPWTGRRAGAAAPSG